MFDSITHYPVAEHNLPEDMGNPPNFIWGMVEYTDQDGIQHMEELNTCWIEPTQESVDSYCEYLEGAYNNVVCIFDTHEVAVYHGYLDEAYPF